MSKHWTVCAWICLISLNTWFSSAVADEVGQATHFFKNHPNAIDVQKQGNSVLFANRHIGVAFKKSDRGFKLTRLYSIKLDQDYLVPGQHDVFQIVMTLDPKHIRRDDRHLIKQGHFVIMTQMAGDAFEIGSAAAKSASWSREGDDTESILSLQWQQIDVKETKRVLDVEVTVRLRADDPLAYWRINIKNRGGRYGIERVRFPNLTLAPIGDKNDNLLLYPRYRGGLIENPFRDGYNDLMFYPHNFNMQFQALYNRKTNRGIYLGTQDPAANFMAYDIRRRNKLISFRPGHFPANITFASEDYTLPYDFVTGPLDGDWYDACQIYRKWALKQSWAGKGTLSQRSDIPKWYKEAPLFFSTNLGDSAQGTHSLKDNIPITVEHFREFLKKWPGVKFPMNWYQVVERVQGLSSYDLPISVYRTPRLGRWREFCTHEVHCGNYPDIPILPDISKWAKILRDEGGMVMPYVPVEFFDQGPSDNAPYANQADPNALRDLYGAKRSWGSNPNWQMCVVTPWWRNRLKETCELMLDRENFAGFYLDVVQGCSLPCYWTPHGHSAAGGDSMTRGMHDLVAIITDAVKAKDPQAIITAENPGENVMDALDGYLQATLRAENTAPIFATVYQGYTLRYGLELSVDEGWRGRFKDTWQEHIFFIESASMFVEGMQVGRVRLRPRSSSLSLTDPKHKPMVDFLDHIVGYYKQDVAKKFLTYGRLLRPLTFHQPSPMPMMFCKTYLDKTGGDFPALMSGVFLADDGDLGVFIVNASPDELAFEADLDPQKYHLPTAGAIDIDSITPKGATHRVQSSVKGTIKFKGMLPGRQFLLFHLQPAAAR